MRPLRIALLSYRSKPHSGGQGIYVRHLSRALADLGHEVTVFSGQPYPELDEGVRLEQVPSLDLYREPDPFRTPRPGEYRDAIDVLEVATMWTAGFPEPMTFSLRAARELRGRLADFDVVHDNQCLGWGLLDIQQRLPLVTTIHHPITMDRRVDLEANRSWRKAITLRRWYGFLRMQGAVARRLRHIVTVSQSSALDIARDFQVDPTRIEVVPLGVQPEIFAEPERARVPGRIVAMASADTPLKGIGTLLEAVAKLRVERPSAHLVLVSKPTPGGRTERLVSRLGLEDAVEFRHGLSVEELAEVMGSAEIACVPSLYEGFSLPTLEAMSCGTPLVVSDAGAIPEVVGEPGVCADLVPAGDAEALLDALRALHDDPHRRARMGAAARTRALTGFSWRTVAEATTAVYERAIAEHSRERGIGRTDDRATHAATGPTDLDHQTDPTG
ncbi:glycosyltransferase family 4 protein [Actinomycetota bacterium]